MKRTLLFIFALSSLTWAQGYLKCENCGIDKWATQNAQGCPICGTSQLYGGCTCSASGGTPACHSESEQCGNCYWDPNTDLYNCSVPAQCCPVLQVAAKTAAAPWLANIDFHGVASDLQKEFAADNVAQLLELRGTAWAKASCTHISGQLKTTYGTKKFDAIFTPQWVEIDLHLDIDRDETFKFSSDGFWVARLDGHLARHKTQLLVAQTNP